MRTLGREKVLRRVRMTASPPGSLCLLRFLLPLRKFLEICPNIPFLNQHYSLH